MSEEIFGRDDEIATVRAAQAARRPGVVITGPAGIGRTTVLAAAAAELRDRHLDVHVVRATASARRLRFAALSAIIGEHFEGPLTFDLVSDALAARSAHGRFALLIDDLHLLDEASIRVIVDGLGRHDSFVAATVDEAHLGLDPLTESGVLDLVRLGPLSVTAVGRIVEGHRGSDADASAWWERCGGNPTALMEALMSSGPTSDHPPSSDLSAAAKRLLAVIALAEPLPTAAGASVAGPDAVTELRTAGIVIVGDDGSGAQLRLRHPGLAPRLRRTLGPLEARGARRAALGALRGNWADLGATGRLRLAALAVDAGVELSEPELIEATTLAPSAGDATLTLRLAREAATRLDRFEDLVRLADVAHEQGEIVDLEQALAEMDRRAGTAAERASVAVARAQHQLWRLGDGSAAVRTLENPAVADEPEVAAVRSRILATVGRVDEATGVALGLITHPSARVRTQALIGTAHALRRAGRPAEAVEVLDTALADRATIVDPVQVVGRQVLTVARAHALTESGRWSDGLDTSARALGYAERYDEAPGRAIAVLIRGVAQLEAGVTGPAAATLSDAVSRFEALRQPAGRRWSLAARALARALCGDVVEARDDLDRLERSEPHPADLFPAFEPRARAWTLVAAADPEAARRLLRTAVPALLDRGAVGAAWMCAHDLVSLDDPSMLLGLADRAIEPFDHLRLEHAAAIHRRDADALASLVDRYEAAGGARWAAECAAAWHAAATRAGDRDGARRAQERLTAALAVCTGLDIPSVAAGRASSLTAREREIALLAARGLTSRAIGDRLGLSVRTVDNHLARCFDKLGVRNRSELTDLLDS